MKDISKMNYSEFCKYLEGEGYDRFEPILSYDEFAVFLDIETDRYYYLEVGEDDADEFFELDLAAILCYDEEHDIKIKKGERLSYFFDCCACGEYITDNNIQYLWFKKKESRKDEDS